MSDKCETNSKDSLVKRAQQLELGAAWVRKFAAKDWKDISQWLDKNVDSESHRETLFLLWESYKSLRDETIETQVITSETVRDVVLPPCYRLARIAGFLLTRRAFKKYVWPVIADAQDECYEAIRAGREWHAWWICVRCWFLVAPGWLYAFLAGNARQ
jgi:hypothetical protein